MDRLQAELQRLYLPRDSAAPGQARALVLGVAGRDSWDHLGPLWQGVQADLQLPAPAIAVSGTEGHQLWFSLAEPVPAAQAGAFLEGLRRRYLAAISPARIALAPTEAAPQAGELPPRQVASERWSAFVAPDLAALFAEEHWLDLAPTPEAQADLLSRLQAMRPADFQRARDLVAASEAEQTVAAQAAQHQDPRRFLLEVMNDRAIALPLRIEAAKALLPWTEGHRGAGH